MNWFIILELIIKYTKNGQKKEATKESTLLAFSLL